jgi:hypothetical protein
MLLGNKADLPPLVSKADVQAFIDQNSISLYFETSAKTDLAVFQAFSGLAEALIKSGVKGRERRGQPLTAQPAPAPDNPPRSKCCG